MLQQAGSIRAVSADGGAAIDRGKLVVAWPDGHAPPLLPPPTLPGSDEVAIGLGDAEEAWLVWKWLTLPDTQVSSSEGPLDLNSMMIPRVVRIAV